MRDGLAPIPYSRLMDKLPGGLLRVTMPLPMRPGHVHCYLLPVDGGFTVVDTGLGLPDARERWAAELGQLDEPVVRLFITHFHPDHLGAAADVRDLTGARVSQGRVDAAQGRLAWESDEWPQVIAAWFHENGVPETVTDELVGQGSFYRPFIRTVSDPELVDDGDRLDGWDVVAAPGHADGQLTLLKDGVLIAADHLLERITPTVGLWPASRPDPLGDYLASLERTIELAPDIAYGGHGDPVTDPVGRARELIAHHHERLRCAAAALGREPRTGYEVSYALFGDDLPPAARRFAVAETLSHLERLVREGRAKRHDAEHGENVVGVSYTAAQ
jgi:glyoxylase-like metal-dependent hydrolase (beta-lactamase superfamily II)